jgi:O-antigen ligase
MNNLARSLEVMFVGALLLLSAGAFAPLWTDPAAHNVVEGQASLQGLWAAIYVATGVALAARWRSWVTLLRAQKLLLALLFLSFASTLWSENPAVTLRKSVALLGTTMVGMLFAARFNMRQQVRLVAATLCIAALASVVAGLWLPETFPATEFASGAWNGVFSHKNLLGRNMAIGAVACLSTSRRTALGWGASLAGAALCCSVLHMAHSQTALLVLLFVLAVRSFSFLLRGDWRTSLGASLLGVLAAALVVAMAITHLDSLTQLLHRDTTLTGRARIWLFATLSIAQRPWLGYGYGAFWWVSHQSQQALALIRYETPHAHNGYLDLLLQLGGVGTAVFALGWMVAAARAVRHLRHNHHPEAHWPILYLIFLAAHSLTENSLLIVNSLLWILYVAASCNLAQVKSPQTSYLCCNPTSVTPA